MISALFNGTIWVVNVTTGGMSRPVSLPDSVFFTSLSRGPPGSIFGLGINTTTSVGASVTACIIPESHGESPSCAALGAFTAPPLPIGLAGAYDPRRQKAFILGPSGADPSLFILGSLPLPLGSMSTEDVSVIATLPTGVSPPYATIAAFDDVSNFATVMVNPSGVYQLFSIQVDDGTVLAVNESFPLGQDLQSLSSDYRACGASGNGGFIGLGYKETAPGGRAVTTFCPDTSSFDILGFENDFPWVVGIGSPLTDEALVYLGTNTSFPGNASYHLVQVDPTSGALTGVSTSPLCVGIQACPTLLFSSHHSFT